MKNIDRFIYKAIVNLIRLYTFSPSNSDEKWSIDGRSGNDNQKGSDGRRNAPIIMMPPAASNRQLKWISSKSKRGY